MRRLEIHRLLKNKRNLQKHERGNPSSRIKRCEQHPNYKFRIKLSIL